jgi:hypothetical protein
VMIRTLVRSIDAAPADRTATTMRVARSRRRPPPPRRRRDRAAPR